MEDADKKGDKKPKSPPPKNWKNIDMDSFKLTLNFAAIVALIFSVYQMTNFVWTNYHDIDRQMYEMKGKHEILILKVDNLEKKIDDTGKSNEKVADKLDNIENFVNKIENQLNNEE